MLTQDVVTREWNFARFGHARKERPGPQSPSPAPPPRLPELLLRDARVDISELKDAKTSTLGFITIDGRLTPTGSAAGRDAYGNASSQPPGYAFVLQSRGVSDAVGPLASGSVDLSTGHIVARLGQFEFGNDVRSLLLSDIGDWADRHKLAGRVNIPLMDFQPGRDGAKPTFTVRMELDGVHLVVPAEEWAGPDENAQHARRKAHWS